MGNGPVRGVAEHQSTCEMKGVVLFVFQGVTTPSPVAQTVRKLLAMQETWVRSLVREGPLEKRMNGNPPQYSCLESPVDRGAWRATIHGVKRLTLLLLPHHHHLHHRHSSETGMSWAPSGGQILLPSHTCLPWA